MAMPEPAPTLIGRFGSTIRCSVIYAPIALSLAFISLALTLAFALGVFMTGWWPLTVAWLVVSHALFINFICAFIKLEQTALQPRVAIASRSAIRGLFSSVILVAIAGALAFFGSPLLSVGLWLGASFTAAPSRFVRRGWRGWLDLARPSPISARHRLALLTPTTLLLLTMTWALSQATDWGLMDGGVVLIPLLGAVMFTGVYSCALFSARFDPQVD